MTRIEITMYKYTKATPMHEQTFLIPDRGQASCSQLCKTASHNEQKGNHT